MDPEILNGLLTLLCSDYDFLEPAGRLLRCRGAGENRAA